MKLPILMGLAIPNPPLAFVVGGGYLIIGLVSGMVLLRRGGTAAAAVGAVVAWPLLLARAEVPTPVSPRGPLHDRIEATFGALADALSGTAAREWALAADLDRLRASLHRADDRLVLADRLLAPDATSADASPSVQASLVALRAARAHAVGEIEAVLVALVGLRIQFGLLALAGGPGAGSREQLRELLARVAALEEVSRFAGPDTSSAGVVVDAVDPDRR